MIAAGRPLTEYPAALFRTPEFKAFHRARNVHQYFTYSMPAGMMATGLAMFTHGFLPPRIAPKKVQSVSGSPSLNGRTRMELCSSLVHLTRVNNRGPGHIVVDDDLCRRCVQEHGQPCARFCPAGVYEPDPQTGQILVHAEACIHCRTCSVRDPYGNIR